MKFIDEIILTIKAGNGGNGCKSFYIKKKKKYPNGGNGGNGGNILAIGDKNLTTLNKYKFKQQINGKNGKNGKKNNNKGKCGKNIFLKLPINTKIIDTKKKKIIGHILNEKDYFIIAKGGKYGKGNLKFNSINKNKLGEKGEIKQILLKINLKLDVGIIGLPNSGKSTIIKKISSAKPKINNYPYTTTTPNLGKIYFKNKKKFTIIDIPGINNKEKKLNKNFLNHIKHCKIILHIIDITLKKKQLLLNINKIINKIKNYYKYITKKKHWIIFNKIDKLKKTYILKNVKYIIKKLKWKNPFYIITAIKKIGLKLICYDIANYIKYN